MRFDNINEGVAKIACLKCDEVSTAKAWEKNNGFCPKCKTSSQGVAESEDTRMGTITVTSDEERKRRAKAYRDKKLKEADGEGTYARIIYDYSENWASIDIYKGHEKVDEWDDYFHSNETGNPLARQFVAMCKKNGLDPMTLPLVDENGDTGKFDGNTFKWNEVAATNEARRSSYEVFRSAQAKARNKKYTPPTQAEIDADRKKDEKGKPRPSMSTKSINKKMYEALTLDYSRYMRSHGKKPKPGYGMWMFTTTDMGEPAEDDMFQFSGSLADAKRAAAKWAKGKGAYRFFVMEKTVTEDDCQCANGDTTQEQLLDMLENAMISIEQDLESGKLMDAHALQLGENYLVYEALYNKIKAGADLGESANQKLDEVDWGTVGNIAMTAAPLLIPGVGVGALAGLAGRAALGALAKRGGAALVKRGLQKVAPNLMQRLGQTKLGRALTSRTAIGGAANTARAYANEPEVLDIKRPDGKSGDIDDVVGAALAGGASASEIDSITKSLKK